VVGSNQPTVTPDWAVLSNTTFPVIAGVTAFAAVAGTRAAASVAAVARASAGAERTWRGTFRRGDVPER
jgi:hypothetical protein